MTFSPWDNISSLQHLIQNIWYQYKIDSTRVGISLSGKKAIVRYIEFPYMENKDLKKALPFEIQTNIPFSLQDAIISFQVIDEFEKSGTKMVRIVYAVSRREEIEKIVNLLEGVGLEVVFIDLDMFSLARAYNFVKNCKGESDILMVNLGASVTNFNFLHNGVSLFARDINWGGNLITSALQNSLKITFKEAEKIKRERVLIFQDKEKKFVPHTYINGPLVQLVKEINLIIHHCLFNFHLNSIDCLYISGGTALLKNLNCFLEEKIGIPVRIFNPFKNMEDNLYSIDKISIPPTLFSTALGIALRFQ